MKQNKQKLRYGKCELVETQEFILMTVFLKFQLLFILWVEYAIAISLCMFGLALSKQTSENKIKGFNLILPPKKKIHNQS